MTAADNSQQAGLPTPESTKSYWHQAPSEALQGFRSTADLPATAEYVIVGSGITGAFAARELVEVAGERGVVMLEAREACWGATGRNGGHCQPLLYTSRAAVGRFELATYRFLRQLVDDNAVPCDWETVGGVHALPDPEVADLVRTHLARLARDAPDLAAETRITDDPEELRRLRVPGAAAAVVQKCAAKLWPYKLVCWVLEELVKKGPDSFNIQTTTPVTNLEQQDSGDWKLDTPRGSITAKKVILATNAYTSRLLPALTGLLIPVRGQVCALVPPEDAPPLEHSHVWISPGGDDYLVQRPSRELILGGERLSVPHGAVGISKDDEVDPVVAARLRRAMAPAVKLRPGDAPEEPELPARWEWTGIMGYSRDSQPWVGRVPSELGGGSGGLWLSGGYTGHGMPVGARGGIAVVEDALGRKERTVELPREYRITAERAVKARRAVLPTTFAEEVRMLLEDVEDE